MSGFDIVFRGDILPGFQIQQVKREMGRLFKAEEAVIDNLFRGGAQVLKKNLDEAAAQRYHQALASVGAATELAPSGSVRTANRAPSSGSAQAAESPRKSLQERLAEQKDETPAPPQQTVAGSVSSTPFQLENDVDTSHLSLREATGDLLDPDEVSRPESVQVVDLNVNLAELGEDLLHSDERKPAAVVSIPELDADVLPVGADLGEMKVVKESISPDISHITLADTL